MCYRSIHRLMGSAVMRSGLCSALQAGRGLGRLGQQRGVWPHQRVSSAEVRPSYRQKHRGGFPPWRSIQKDLNWAILGEQQVTAQKSLPRCAPRCPSENPAHRGSPHTGPHNRDEMFPLLPRGSSSRTGAESPRGGARRVQPSCGWTSGWTGETAGTTASGHGARWLLQARGRCV